MNIGLLHNTALLALHCVCSKYNVLLSSIAEAILYSSEKAITQASTQPRLLCDHCSTNAASHSKVCNCKNAKNSISGTANLNVQAMAVLPNGWQVSACSEVEARFIYTEIVEQQCYLQEGIQINDGDVVMDIGANIGE